MEQGKSKTGGYAFYTVVELENGTGYSGGLLVLTPTGRPLEFHCTAPVKPNRAQEILYGPTLKPYLFGEQIGSTLVEKAKTQIGAVFTDREQAASLRSQIAIPVVLVQHETDNESLSTETNASASSPAGRSWRLDQGHESSLESNIEWQKVSAGRFNVAISSAHPGDEDEYEKRVLPDLHLSDLSEPFLRIREAIDEALQTSR